MQNPNDLISFFTEPLSISNIDYMITGSVACTIYGEPRLTHDIDMVLQLSVLDYEKLIEVYSAEDFYTPPAETIQEEVSRPKGGMLNIIHHASGFKADLYFQGQDPLLAWGMKNKQKVKFHQKTLWLAPVEYVILKKLEYFKAGSGQRHIRDISGILHVHPEISQSQDLHRWLKERKIDDLWQEHFA